MSQSTSSGNAKDDEIKIQDYEQESSYKKTAGGLTTDGPSDTDLKRQKGQQSDGSGQHDYFIPD